jgi:hypothetical protein
MKVIVTYAKIIIEEKEIEVDDKYKVLETGCNHLSFNEIGKLKDGLTKEISKDIFNSDDYIELKSARNSENDEMLWEW